VKSLGNVYEGRKRERREISSGPQIQIIPFFSLVQKVGFESVDFVVVVKAVKS